jgi:hypothetical protein
VLLAVAEGMLCMYSSKLLHPELGMRARLSSDRSTVLPPSCDMSNGSIGLPTVAEARVGVEAADEEARASGATCKRQTKGAWAM